MILIANKIRGANNFYIFTASSQTKIHINIHFIEPTQA